jgi:hypothetical protein
VDGTQIKVNKLSNKPSLREDNIPNYFSINENETVDIGDFSLQYLGPNHKTGNTFYIENAYYEGPGTFAIDVGKENFTIFGIGSFVGAFGTIPYEPIVPCFHEDTKILTIKGNVPIRLLRKGDLVKTVAHGFVPIHSIGYKPFPNSGTDERVVERLYVCKKSEFPTLSADLILTGNHSILVKSFQPGEKDKMLEVLKRVYVTDNHYRLPAYAMKKTQPYVAKGIYNVFNLALEHSMGDMNYGIYANNLLVETSCIIHMKKNVMQSTNL